MLNVPIPISVPEIRVSDSVSYVSDIVSEISRSLKYGVFEILVDIPVSVAPNLIFEISNVVYVNISYYVSHNLSNASLFVNTI